MTIGRLKNGFDANKVREVLEDYDEVVFGTCTISEVVLVESILSPREVRYLNLFKHSLVE